MKDRIKSRISRERWAKFFDREGFYIVLFLCVCVVAVTAVWVSRTGLKNDIKKNASNDQNKTEITTQPEQTDTEAENDRNVNTTPATEQNANTEANNKTTNKTSKPTSTQTGQTTKPTNGTVTNSKSLPVRFGNPIDGDLTKDAIMQDFSPSDLVCFKHIDEWRTHMGVDIRAVKGTDVIAAGSGKVIDVQNDNESEGGLGWKVVVDHGNGYRTVYANLAEKLAVKKNQEVKIGQKIGTVGNTSITEKDVSQDVPVLTHLHYEILKSSSDTFNNIDPKTYMKFQK
ncbi:MAG: peptidoglycan DD-metalloendopeptidase family protein [Clostridiales bacterium]|nr:peptidoglycan DD-metalloendopeptidase family protein [Clostridiales bacterium]